MQGNPVAKDLVLIGGGHSHVVLLRGLAMKPVPGLQITLISPDVITPYSGMLPGVVSGNYQSEDIHIDLVPLCRFAGARFFKTSARSIDPASKTVQCDGRPDVAYDLLSIDIGITPSLDGVPGARENVIAVKPISRFLRKWEQFLERALTGEIHDVGFVGGGVGGVELCLAVSHRLRTEMKHRGEAHEFTCHLVTNTDTILPELDAGTRKRFLRHCDQQGIVLHRNFTVSRVDRGTLASVSGETLPVDEVFWVTSAAAPSWLSDTGLSLDEDGFITVRDTLQTDSHEDIFAAGDIAHMLTHPRPKAGVFAVRQGPALERNIRRRLFGKPLKPFKPQKHFLKLITTGGRHAVACRNELSVEGAWVWVWKDWIDRRFVRRFNDLPDMQAERHGGLLKEFDEQMHCGGCGSKVGAALLTEVLDRLGVETGARDDAAVYSPTADQLMLHSVDGFRSFIDDPYVFAQVTTRHALADIYAMGARPVTALALVTLPFSKPDKTRTLLEQLLAGVLEVLEEEGVALVGGHTGEGAELSLGLAVNGSATADALLNKSGMQSDDVLLLTKPLGTGALFAADMQHKARGVWIDGAIEHMLQSNRAAATCLREHGASACTDVTGFGLAGHLTEMLVASSMEAILDLSALPVMDGALEVIGEGITSSLHEGNRQAVSSIEGSENEKYEILFDPQTAGGLLASVPAARAIDCRQALHRAGYSRAALIGEIKTSAVPRIVLKHSPPE